MSLEAHYKAIRQEITKVIYGQDEVVDFALAALFSSGHVLLEGPPGVAKTLLVRTIAAALNLDYRRVQMTPDLLPIDITGSSLFREDTRTFEFRPGPVFTNFLLADEINRSSARTQSAFLEAMQELCVTYDGVTHPLPEPFITFATQNPIEQEGTYPLPLAQLDRFMFKVEVTYPGASDEERILRDHHATGGLSNPARLHVQAVVGPRDILEARESIRQTHIREEVIGYVRRLVHATRGDDSLTVGGSPRSGLMLLMGAKSLARFAGRDFVIPDDIKAAFVPVMRHRVVLSPSAELEGTTADAVLGNLLESVEVARVRIRPGRNLVRAAAGLLVLAPLTFVWSDTPWLPALGFALVVAGVVRALDYRQLQACFRGVKIQRSMPTVVGRGLPFEVGLRVFSSGRLHFAGKLRDQVPAAAFPAFQVHTFGLPADGSASLAATFRIPVRGSFEFGPAWLRLTGPLDVLEAQQVFTCPGSVKVLPEGFSSTEGLRHDERAELLLLDKISRVRQTGLGTEFEMLSEYRPGDDPRRIDWKTSVRVRRPVVRRFQVERHRDVMIVIDCGRLMGADAGRGSKLDCAVDSALMLCRTALEGGDRCGLAVFDNRVVVYRPPLSGPRALRGLVESVYSVQSRWAESDFGLMFATLQSRQTKRSLVVILSDIVDIETSTRFRTSLATLSRRHVVLFAALRTPLLREIVAEPVETLLDGSRKAVTFRILREREEALGSLKRSGVQILDVEPSRLTVPLLNRFMELRRQNVL